MIIEICPLKLSALFAGVELTDNMEKEIVGTTFKDEEGNEVGKIIKASITDDIAICTIDDPELAEKMIKQYGVTRDE